MRKALASPSRRYGMLWKNMACQPKRTRSEDGMTDLHSAIRPISTIPGRSSIIWNLQNSPPTGPTPAVTAWSENWSVKEARIQKWLWRIFFRARRSGHRLTSRLYSVSWGAGKMPSGACCLQAAICVWSNGVWTKETGSSMSSY